MNRFKLVSSACFALAAMSLLAAPPAQAQSADTGFFVTSNGIGNGADLGGLAGADNHCQTLAQAAGFGAPKTWHAYLSTQAADGAAAVNARDRIGKGPWQNTKGVVIAKDVADLHSAGNNLTKQTALSEKGEVINGRGDTPNRHDALTARSRRHRVRGRRRPHLQELDEFDARLGDARSYRSHRAARRRRLEIVEFVASLARAGRRLFAGRPQEHRRRRLAVLLRGELRVTKPSMKIIDAQVHIWSKTVTPTTGLHRKVSSFTAEELLKEMDEAGVDAALIHPPRGCDPDSNALAIEAARKYPDRFAIMGQFALDGPTTANWFRAGAISRA